MSVQIKRKTSQEVELPPFRMEASVLVEKFILSFDCGDGIIAEIGDASVSSLTVISGLEDIRKSAGTFRAPFEIRHETVTLSFRKYRYELAFKEGDEHQALLFLTELNRAVPRLARLLWPIHQNLILVGIALPVIAFFLALGFRQAGFVSSRFDDAFFLLAWTSIPLLFLLETFFLRPKILFKRQNSPFEARIRELVWLATGVIVTLVATRYGEAALNYFIPSK